MNRISDEPIYAYYEETAKNQVMFEHSHSQYELILVTEGSVRFHVADSSYDMAAGDLILISALERHSISVLSFPYKRYVLAVSGDLCSLYIQEPLLLSILSHRPNGFCHKLSLPPTLQALARQRFQLLTEETVQKKPLWKQRSLLLLTDLLILLFRDCRDIFPQKKDPSILHLVIQVQNYIGLHYQEPLTLDSVASVFYISKYHLSRSFKEITGYGYREYLLLYRLNQAKKLLETTSLSVLEISAASGFQNINHFIHAFRAHEDITPLQYRKRLRAPLGPG